MRGEFERPSSQDARGLAQINHVLRCAQLRQITARKYGPFEQFFRGIPRKCEFEGVTALTPTPSRIIQERSQKSGVY